MRVGGGNPATGAGRVRRSRWPISSATTSAVTAISAKTPPIAAMTAAGGMSRVSCIGSLTGLAKHLPERDPHPQLYYGALEVLGALDDARVWPALLVRWEMLLLQDLGFGLDLSECAATGSDAELIYVSPKSGRAVSRDAGQPYCDRLLKLPRFLLEDDASPTPSDILAGFALTGHFFERDVLAPHGLTPPAARERLIGLLARAEATTT